MPFPLSFRECRHHCLTIESEANPNNNNLMMINNDNNNNNNNNLVMIRWAGLSDIRVWLCRSKNIDPMFNCCEPHNTENQWSLSLCPTDSAVRGFSAERRGWGGWVNQCGWDLILDSAGHEMGILIVFSFVTISTILIAPLYHWASLLIVFLLVLCWFQMEHLVPVMD